MLNKTRILKVFITLFTITCIYYYVLRNQSYRHLSKSSKQLQCESDYKRQCMRLFTNLGSPNKSLVFSPPLKDVPAEMLDEFTQHGEMPIMKYSYINEAHDNTNPYFKYMEAVLKQAEVNKWRAKVKKDESLGYNSFLFETTLVEHARSIANKNFLVVGTQHPWIEALALELSARGITTLDYAKRKYEQDDLKWHQVKKYSLFQSIELSPIYKSFPIRSTNIWCI